MKGEFYDYIIELEQKRREYFELIEKTDIRGMSDLEVFHHTSDLRSLLSRMEALNKEILGCIGTLEYNVKYIQGCCLADNMPGKQAIENLLLGKA